MNHRGRVLNNPSYYPKGLEGFFVSVQTMYKDTFGHEHMKTHNISHEFISQNGSFHLFLRMKQNGRMQLGVVCNFIYLLFFFFNLNLEGET